MIKQQNILIDRLLMAVYGTLFTSTLGVFIATVVGVSIALLLTQYRKSWLLQTMSYLVEFSAALPSVIYGLWGLFVLMPRLHISGLFAAGTILGVMMMPVVTTTAAKVMKAVPLELQEAAITLGASRWEKVRLVILPYSVRGILGSILLGFGRALGETVAVTMVLGHGETITSMIARGFLTAHSAMTVAGYYETGLLLLIIYLLFRSGSRWLIKHVSPLRS